MELFAQPQSREWIFAWRSRGDPLTETLCIEVPTTSVPDNESCDFARFVVGETPSALTLTPRLGNRPFIVRPESPLFLLAGQNTVLFVSTVVWVAACLSTDNDEGKPTVLLENPAARPSDTWFGRNTRKGELCYASRTNARIDLAAVARRPHRAVTPVEIRNEGNDMLSISQLRVPVPALSLHQDEDDRLWTDAVRLVREEGETEASLTVPERSDHLPKGRTLLASPKQPVESGTIVEAFSRFLG
jgi:hypothetical protein